MSEHYDQLLDARGLSCPMPLLKTRQALRQLAPGQVLQVVASDAGSGQDIPAWIRQSDHELVHFLEEGEQFCFRIRVGEGAGQA
jgi:tRNA 2-thiouridine synthesizing protein A